MTSALDAARAELEAAGERQREINKLIAKSQKVLDELAAERANKGRGAPNLAHRARKTAHECKISRLQRGFLPSEVSAQSTAPQTSSELRASAAHHPQHHAAAGTAPLGRSRASGNGGGSNAGGGSGLGGINAAEGGDDDDEEDANFHQFYRVSKTQKEWNESVAYEYQHGELDRRIISVQPYQLIGGGCQPEHIGLGPVHICAPHLHMGLPLPPCPKHGWASYDQGKLRTRGWCPARRCSDLCVDGWLLGVCITCDLCHDEKRKAEEQLAKLEEDDDLEGTEELAAARAEVAAATYCYR